MENAWEQRMFTTMQKRCIEEKFFYENVSDLISFLQDLGLLFLFFFSFGFIFFRTLIPVILFPETLLAASMHIILGKNSRESKTQDFIFSDILS